MTLPTWVAAGAANQGTGAVTYALPAGQTTDDILLLAVETANEAVSTPSGYTQITNSPVSQALTDVTRLSVFWKRATASEASVLVADPGDHQIGQMYAIRGCATTGNPFDITYASTGASLTTHSVTGVASLSPQSLFLLLFTHGLDTQTNIFMNNDWSASGITWTHRDYNSGNQGNGGGLGVATGPLALPSTPGTTTFTTDLGVTTARMIISFRAASAAVSGTDTGTGVEAHSVYRGKIGAQVDTFGSLNTAFWSSNYGTPTVSGGELYLSCINTYEGVQTSYPYDLTDSSAVIKTVQVPVGGGASRQSYMRMVLDANNNVEFLVDGSTLYARKKEAGSITTVQNVGTYNATTHKWWKIQSDNVAGTNYVSFWTSSDGANWTQQGAGVTTTFSQVALYPEIGCGYYGTETSPPDFIVDDFNNAFVAKSSSDTGSGAEGAPSIGQSSADHFGVPSIFGVYKGYGATAITAVGTHETLAGRNVQIGNDYLYHSSWAAFNYSDMRTLQLDLWRTWRNTRPGSQFVYGIPLLTNSNVGDFAGVVAGTYDSYFQIAANALVDSGNGDAIIRLGWEPNNANIGSWHATSNPSGYISAYQHVVTLFRNTAGSNFKFSMVSSIGPSGSITAFTDYYPGDAYVDYLGMNIYDMWYNTPATPEARWANTLNTSMGLAAHTTFAQSHSKPIIFDEWGLYATGDIYNGGGDNPYFIDRMADYFITVKPYYQSYFDFNWGGGVLADFPNGEARYKARFKTAGTIEFGSLIAGLSSGDTGSAAQASSTSATLSSSDTGTGANTEDVSQSVVPKNSSDTGSGTESQTLAASISGADTGTGAEAGSTAATLSNADTASGAEARSIATTLSGADTGSGAESGSAEALTSLPAKTSVPGRARPGMATPGAVEAFLLDTTAPVSHDTATSAETQSVVVSLSGSDTGSATESGTVDNLVEGSDSTSGVEASSLIATLSESDTGSGVDSGTIAAALNSSDTSSGAEQASVGVSSSDSASGADVGSAVQGANAYETGAFVESGSIVAHISSSDDGSATETEAFDNGPVIPDYSADLVMGPATIYIGDFGSPEPTGSEVISPPSASYWRDMGSTLAGVTLTVEHTFKSPVVTQIPMDTSPTLERRKLTAKASLVEPTLINLLQLLNNGTVASGGGYQSYTPQFLDRATPLSYQSVIIYGWAPNLAHNNKHKRRMVIMRKCLAVNDVEMDYTPDSLTAQTVEWTIHYIDGSTAPFKILDEV